MGGATETAGRETGEGARGAEGAVEGDEADAEEEAGVDGLIERFEPARDG